MNPRSRDGGSPDVVPATAHTLGSFIELTSSNLGRANEIVDTLISRIEGLKGQKQDDSGPSPDCLMTTAAHCNHSSGELGSKLDYLAKLITGGC